jgi:hypothetical protein
MIAVLVLSAVLSSATTEQDAVFKGPLHYCGMSFSIDLAKGEKIEVKEGPDFLVEGLISERGGYGIYEGNFPQNGTDGEVVKAGLGKSVKQLPKDEFGLSYVVLTGEKFPAFVHTWGKAFTGAPRDFALLRRMNFAPAKARRCDRPTYKWKH